MQKLLGLLIYTFTQHKYFQYARIITFRFFLDFVTWFGRHADMLRRILLPEYSGQKSEPNGVRECLMSGRKKLDRDHKQTRGPK